MRLRKTSPWMILALLLIAPACVTSGSKDASWLTTRHPDSGKPLLPSAEADLILALIKQTFAKDLAVRDYQLILVDESLPVVKHSSRGRAKDPVLVAKSLPGIDKSCLASFYRVNKQRFTISFGEPMPQLQLLGMSRINQLYQDGGWAGVVKQVPGARALISVSRPGLCRNLDEAILYMAVTEANSEPTEFMIKAHRDHDQWTLTTKKPLSAVADDAGATKPIVQPSQAPVSKHSQETEPKTQETE